jgi:ribosome biogenesis GTPase
VSTDSPQPDDPHTTSSAGIVYKKYTGKYTVQVDGHMLLCDLSPRLRASMVSALGSHAHRAAEHLDPLVVGDQVRCIHAGDGNGLIVEQFPRRNQFSRRSAVPMPSARPHEQVIAANVDQVVPVFAAAEPPPKWNLLDRYLVAAEAADLPALVCITKLDLVKTGNDPLEPELARAVAEYRRIGYPVLLVSAHTDEGLPELEQTLAGRVSVLLGKSGVGKTSLLNALQPGLGLRVNAVNQVTGKGKHTTTAMEMFPLEFESGGAIIDTPGVREFGLWIEDGQNLDWFFPEMRPFIGTCRFGLDCQHDQEPGCDVRKAVTAGLIDPRRWQSYLQLRGDV